MTDLSAKFSTLEEQLAAQASTMEGYVDTVETKLQALFDQLDLMLINNAANTRYLLAALAASSPCSPCPTPSLSVPPVDGSEHALSEDKCKRAQAFVHALLEIATVTDAISAFSIPFAPQLIIDAIDEVITAIGNGDPTPLMSWSEASNFVSQAIVYIAGNFLVGGNLVSMISDLAFDIRDVTYNAPSPADAKAAYDALIDASDVPDYAKGLLKAFAYNDLVTFYFDPLSSLNTTGYSGTACNEILPTDCVILTSVAINIGFGDRQTIALSPSWSGFTAYNDDHTLGVLVYAEAHPGASIYTTPITLDSTWLYVAQGKFWFTREGPAFDLRFCPPS